MRPVTAAFFDLDGCLVDSHEAITTCINHALTDAGLSPRPAAELASCIGPPLLESFARLLTEAGADPGRAPALVAAYREVYPEVARRTTRVIDGIPELLAVLHGSVHLAVVTSKPGAFARPILEAVGLGRWFGAVHAPELDELAEPKVVTLARALAEVDHVDPSATVMVGDRHHDVAAGRDCGTITVGVTWGVGTREELVAAGADHLVDRPADLLSVLLTHRSAGRHVTEV